MFWAKAPSLDMLAQKIDEQINVLILSLWIKQFFFFFWVIVTWPLERLPTYLSYRESSPNIIQKKSFEKSFFFFFEISLSLSLFFCGGGGGSNLVRMRLFEILFFSNEQKVIIWTTSLTNHNVQLLTRSHWLERIWSH